jgi:hypothetical protein
MRGPATLSVRENDTTHVSFSDVTANLLCFQLRSQLAEHVEGRVLLHPSIQSVSDVTTHNAHNHYRLQARALNAVISYQSNGRTPLLSRCMRCLGRWYRPSGHHPRTNGVVTLFWGWINNNITETPKRSIPFEWSILQPTKPCNSRTFFADSASSSVWGVEEKSAEAWWEATANAKKRERALNYWL